MVCQTDLCFCQKVKLHLLNAPRKKMRSLQIRRKKQLESLGFAVYCIDGIQQIGGVIDEIQSS